MEENKKQRDWTGLVLEFIVVVLGIAITFAGEALIKRSYEQEEVRSSLRLVCDELRDDISYVKSCDSTYVVQRMAADFLCENVGQYYTCNQDSLNKHCNPLFFLSIYSESREALELLKNSGVFSKINDKSLALDIIHAYGYLQDYMASGKFYSDKMLRMIEEVTSTPEIRKVLAAPNVTAAEVWDTITKDEEGDYFLREARMQLYNRQDAQAVIDAVQEVIDKIEAYCK